MNAKTNTNVAPTSQERLRAALAERNRLGAASSELMKKIARLAPLEAEVAMAQAELDQILQKDADALKAWAQSDAQGTPPDVNAKAREDAARKLANARSRLGAADGAKKGLEQELLDINHQLQAHKFVVDAAEADIVGERALLLAEQLRSMYITCLEMEGEYVWTQHRLKGYLSAPDMTPTAHGPVITAWFERLKSLNSMTNEERLEITDRGGRNGIAELERLLSGADPVK